jgi:PPK2 family polyphosphate:nucleotide phosphotransferase
MILANGIDLKEFARRFRVEPGKKIALKKQFDPGDTAGYEKPENAGALLQKGVQVLSEYQEKLYAENSRALLVILQALDAAGKDSTLAHVMSGVNPVGCQVYSFKAPSAEELDHDYLWRTVRALPERGRIGIFNRSHYEEVLVVRVHPSFLTAQRLPPATLGKGLWPQRFEEINNFEKYLVQNGTEIVKIYLNVSKEEQRLRQLERIDRPEKNWKFNPGDIEERNYWDEYMAAYEDMFNHTSTRWAPWHIVPADHKWFTRLAVAAIIADKLVAMDPQFPTVSPEAQQEMLELRKGLIAEGGDPRASVDGASPESPNGKRNGKKKKKK